jgi:lipopolysaccharide transport system ATP-binding protein
MPPVIRVENLSKLYRLGEVGTGSLAHDVNRWWHRIRGKEDPYLQVGQVNDRTRKKTEPGNQKSEDTSGLRSQISCLSSDYVYALKDINFEVQQGEVLGIIGRNGAGKSTLLKILSRVTAPTTGSVKVKGRIAALLEVGTGFHPELTGRENILLNGAILGMTKAEIRGKLDQIVDFSGCEAYLDTPVKRYSSGMQVRLAFAVAAHLEPEILIVDEVLAVGDAEFQKKCIGRMSEVAGEGRTVLFVSHNLGAVRKLCTAGMVMNCGTARGTERLEKALEAYALENGQSATDVDLSKKARANGHGDQVRIERLRTQTAVPQFGEPWNIELTATSKHEVPNAVVSLGFRTVDGSRVMSLDTDLRAPGLVLRSGINKIQFTIKFNPLSPGVYSVGCSIWKNSAILDVTPRAVFWEVGSGSLDTFSHRGFGGCRPEFEVVAN